MSTKTLERNPFEATKHLSEINRLAWDGDRLPPTSPFRSDGATIVRREDVAPETGLDRVAYDEATWKPMSTTEAADEVWQAKTSMLVEEAGIDQVVDVSDVSRGRGYDRVAIIESAGGKRVYANAHKIRLACYWTRPDSIGVGARGRTLILYREKRPVAVVMALRPEYPEADIEAALAND